MRLASLAAVLAVALIVAALASGEDGTRFREAVRGPAGAIATEAPDASAAAKAILDAGGNAIDAAAAAVFAVNVVRPQSCGVGGGGFLVYRRGDGQAAALDFRERAPAAITPDVFAQPGPHTGFTGHTTIGVPGVVAGMAAALERYGTLSLATVIAPAEKLAREGFAVPQSLSAAMAQAAPRLRLYEAAAEQFLVGGVAPYPPGQRLVQTALADTFKLLRERGPDAFYRGEIAKLIVADMKTGPRPGTRGLMTEADLADYRAVWREPLRTTYRGREVIAMPPPTSGGIAVVEMLNILEGFDLKAAGASSADHLHFLAEAQKIAWADRNQYVADTDHVKVPVATLTSKEYAAKRRTEIDPARAGSYQAGDVGDPAARSRPAAADPSAGGDTTHLSIVDAQGNAVALTCSIETSFGSAVVPPGTGILMNNELTDFGGAGSANEPRPGKRPRSSMSPTIVVQDGRPLLALGGAGGPRIIMGSLQGAVNAVDFGLDPARAVDAERLDDPSGTMTLEDGRVAPAVVAELRVRGHTIQPAGEYDILPRVQAVGVDAAGVRAATSDPRTDYAAVLSDGRPAARDREPPLAALHAPRFASSTATGPRVALRWSGQDGGGSGVAGFDVDYRVVGLRTDWQSLARMTAATTQIHRATAGRNYEYRVFALDRAGNRSSAAQRRVAVPLDDARAPLRFSPGWQRVHNRSAYGGSYVRARAGASISLAFRGSGVAIVGPRRRGGAELALSVDGRTPRIVRTGGRPRPRALLVVIRGLRPGRHRLTLRVRGLGTAALDALAPLP